MIWIIVIKAALSELFVALALNFGGEGGRGGFVLVPIIVSPSQYWYVSYTVWYPRKSPSTLSSTTFLTLLWTQHAMGLLQPLRFPPENKIVYSNLPHPLVCGWKRFWFLDSTLRFVRLFVLKVQKSRFLSYSIPAWTLRRWFSYSYSPHSFLLVKPCSTLPSSLSLFWINFFFAAVHWCLPSPAFSLPLHHLHPPLSLFSSVSYDPAQFP